MRVQIKRKRRFVSTLQKWFPWIPSKEWSRREKGRNFSEEAPLGEGCSPGVLVVASSSSFSLPSLLLHLYMCMCACICVCMCAFRSPLSLSLSLSLSPLSLSLFLSHNHCPLLLGSFISISSFLSPLRSRPLSETNRTFRFYLPLSFSPSHIFNIFLSSSYDQISFLPPGRTAAGSCDQLLLIGRNKGILCVLREPHEESSRQISRESLTDLL